MRLLDMLKDIKNKNTFKLCSFEITKTKTSSNIKIGISIDFGETLLKVSSDLFYNSELINSLWRFTKISLDLFYNSELKNPNLLTENWNFVELYVPFDYNFGVSYGFETNTSKKHDYQLNNTRAKVI